MEGYESWSTKKAEHWRIDAFELWCWRRLLRVPWTARRSNQPILKKTNAEYWKDWCWSSNTLATYLIQRADSLGGRTWCCERLSSGKEGGDRGWDGQMASLTQRTWFEQTPGEDEWQGSLACWSPWAHRVGHSLVTKQQHNPLFKYHVTVF